MNALGRESLVVTLLLMISAGMGAYAWRMSVHEVGKICSLAKTKEHFSLIEKYIEHSRYAVIDGPIHRYGKTAFIIHSPTSKGIGFCVIELESGSITTAAYTHRTK